DSGPATPAAGARRVRRMPHTAGLSSSSAAITGAHLAAENLPGGSAASINAKIILEVISWEGQERPAAGAIACVDLLSWNRHTGSRRATSLLLFNISRRNSLREFRWLQMSDPYFEAVQKQWSNIRALYMMYEDKRPIVLYDIHENKIYAYPYKEFKSDLSKKSQVSLEQDYKSASALRSMVVFVRDNIERKLVSYVVSIDAANTQ
ncbi:MAG: hypothetical protein WAN75_49985, partial [Xanthobacteraceae bacterium]